MINKQIKQTVRFKSVLTRFADARRGEVIPGDRHGEVIPGGRQTEGFLGDQRGEGFIDVLVKMLIVVVVGAVLLTIMRAAIPSMFEDMMTKIRTVFEL